MPVGLPRCDSPTTLLYGKPRTKEAPHLDNHPLGVVVPQCLLEHFQFHSVLFLHPQTVDHARERAVRRDDGAFFRNK